jgi:alpha-tubulin suppressor-like RCC1 family protein
MRTSIPRAARAFPLLALLAGCSLVLDPSDLMGGGDGGAPDAPVSDAPVSDAPVADAPVADAPDAGDGGVVLRPVAISAGRAHTCAIREDQAVFCWGSNDYGQMGQPPGLPVFEPTQVAFPSDARATQIALGEVHSCALLDDRTVWCWGYNDAVQGHDRLGSDSMMLTQSHAPVRVVSDSEPLGDVMEIAVGFWHACARRQGGLVSCWGQNASGELGTGCFKGPCVQLPGAHTVEGIAAATAIAAGSGSSCAVVATEVLCWGFNEGNQLGLLAGLITPAPPAQVGRDGRILSGVDRVFAGGGNVFSGEGLPFRGHLFALPSEEGLFCWGANDHGQCDDRFGDDMVTSAFSIISLPYVSQMGLGYAHTCAVYNSGSVTCWGDGRAGQLGLSSRRIPTDDPIALDGPARAVTLGESHTCTVLTDDSIYCWGDNTYGQLGSSAAPGGMNPVRVELPPVP